MTTNHVSHVRWIYVEGNKYTSFVNGSLSLYLIRVVDNRFYHVVNKSLILFHKNCFVSSLSS